MLTLILAVIIGFALIAGVAVSVKLVHTERTLAMTRAALDGQVKLCEALEKEVKSRASRTFTDFLLNDLGRLELRCQEHSEEISKFKRLHKNKCIEANYWRKRAAKYRTDAKWLRFERDLHIDAIKVTKK